VQLILAGVRDAAEIERAMDTLPAVVTAWLGRQDSNLRIPDLVGTV